MNKEIIDALKIVFKETMKFALLAVMSLLLATSAVMLIMIYVLKIDIRTMIPITGIVAGIIAVVFIVVIDDKKMHSNDKIFQANLKIFKILFKNKIGDIKKRNHEP